MAKSRSRGRASARKPNIRSCARRPGATQPRLGEILLCAGLINEDQLAEALERQRETGERLGRILVSLGYVSDDQVADALAGQLGLKRVRLGSQPIDTQAMGLLDADFSRRHRVAVISRDGQRLLAVTPNPLDLSTIDEVRRRLSDYDVEIGVVSEREFAQLEGTLSTVQGLPSQVVHELGGPVRSDPETLERVGKQKPAARLVERIITRAISERASDVHIEPHGTSTLVRFRVDGVLRDIMRLPKSVHKMVVARIKVLSNLDIAVNHVPQDGHFRWAENGESMDIRVSTLPVVGGEKVVMRLLGSSELKITLDEIGFPPEMVERFRAVLDKPQGMILVTGPTGSGKTTTLYAALEYILRRRPNITTIEDPVERDIVGLNQVQVNEKRGLTFLTALRAILRQDPDVIMIGETRDAETARTAFQAALTGHLVLTTLHTNDAAAAITRLVDLGLPTYLIAATLLGSLAQRLVRRVCDHCARWVPVKPFYRERLCQVGICEEIEMERVGTGCDKCRQTGFIGRIAIGELIEVTAEIEQLIAAGAPEAEIRATAIRSGMPSMADVAAEFVREGTTTVAEVLRVLPPIAESAQNMQRAA